MPVAVGDQERRRFNGARKAVPWVWKWNNLPVFYFIDPLGNIEVEFGDIFYSQGGSPYLVSGRSAKNSMSQAKASGPATASAANAAGEAGGQVLAREDRWSTEPGGTGHVQGNVGTFEAGDQPTPAWLTTQSGRRSPAEVSGAGSPPAARSGVQRARKAVPWVWKWNMSPVFYFIDPSGNIEVESRAIFYS